MDKKAYYYFLGFISVAVLLRFLLNGVIQEKNIEPELVDDGKITIGFCMDTMVIERWQRDKEIFDAKARELGCEVLIYNANENNSKQIEQIRYLIEKQVDVIVVIPYDKSGITEAIKEAKKAGIKVISYDRLIFNADVDAYVSFDNEKVGELMAESLLEVAPTGNYVIINGSPSDFNSTMFNEGYKKVLQPYVDSGDIAIIEEVWADNWREEPAYDIVSKVLNSGENIDAIIGANDRLAEAAIRSLTEFEIAGDVPVAGHDADISACQRIIEGTQLVTVYKPIRVLAEAAVDLAVKLAKDEPLNSTETISDGIYEVPFFKYDVIAVTKDNMDETVIKDGFHLKEDVYRNEEN